MKRLRHYNKELAVVLSVFGSSEPHAMSQYDLLKQEIKDSLPPETEVRMAISSRTVLKKLGQQFYTLPQELANVDRLGYKKVVVASVNMFPTDEHDYVLKITEAFKNISPARYEVTAPLFTKTKPTNEYLKALNNDLRQKYGDTDIVYLAHGASNLYCIGNQAFLYVREYLKTLNPRNFFHTIEGAFKYEGDRDGVIVPLLLVTGVHQQDFKVIENFCLLNLEKTRQYFINEIQEAIKKCSI